MLILTMRTDNKLAEIGLYDGDRQLAYQTWEAHRQLAETIHAKIMTVLLEGDKRLHELQAILAFKGPGSFTGLRIGLSVANALAYSLDIPVVAADGNDWLANGINRLINHETDTIALPEYGALPNITPPKH